MNRSIGYWIWIFTFLIVGMGLVTLYSAAHLNVRVSHKVFYDQLACAILGFILMLLLSRIDYRKFYDIAYVVYGLNVILLFMVLAGGRHALGAQRWIEIGGLSVQPSEFSKLAIILALGRYFSEHKPKLSFNLGSTTHVLLGDLLLPLIIVGFPMLLIFKQPDLGTAIVFLGIFMIMLFASGIHYHYFIGFIVLCLITMPFTWHILKPYQQDRLLVFLNPNLDPLGAGYTIIQSKIAIGSGLLFGKGWLAGTQNQLNFLPERHTDFIFAVIGEEWGLAGTLFLLGCYFGLVYCGLKIAGQVKDKFGTQVAIGIVGILAIQVVINMGMTLGLCPVVGITLPLVSYGRSSFMVFIVMMGFLLNLSTKRTVF